MWSHLTLVFERWLAAIGLAQPRVTLKDIAGQLHGIHAHLNQSEARIMATLDDLAIKVGQVKDVEASAVALIQGLIDQLRAADGNSQKITELIDQLDAATTPLSKAIAANTFGQPASR